MCKLQPRGIVLWWECLFRLLSWRFTQQINPEEGGGKRICQTPENIPSWMRRWCWQPKDFQPESTANLQETSRKESSWGSSNKQQQSRHQDELQGWVPSTCGAQSDHHQGTSWTRPWPCWEKKCLVHSGAGTEAASAGVLARRCTRVLGESSGRCWPKFRDGVSAVFILTLKPMWFQTEGEVTRPCVAKSFFSNKCYKLPYECSKFRRNLPSNMD